MTFQTFPPQLLPHNLNLTASEYKNEINNEKNINNTSLKENQMYSFATKMHKETTNYRGLSSVTETS